MKNRIFKIMAVALTAIFVFGSGSVFAAPSSSKVSKDYRNMDILNTNKIKVNKPTAQFAANRVVNGEVADIAISYDGYNCETEIPTLVCYVGDTLTFTDMSRDNNGGKIVEWDWQMFGSLGNKYDVYNRNIVNEESFTLTQPGETTFFLCVKSNIKVKTGCCDPWSENGNHQTVGRNKWFPNGAYWYFTAVRVVVQPAKEAVVHVRYWDAQNNKIFHEETVNTGPILDTQTVDVRVHITDWEGYEYSGWNVQLPDGTIQYSGAERDVEIALAGWVPEKYLNVEFYPATKTSVTVRYWNSAMNKIMAQETISGERVFRDKEAIIDIDIRVPEDYKYDEWNVQLPDGTIQYKGSENPVKITLNGYIPKKFLNVECYSVISKKVTVNYINSESGEIIKTNTIRLDDDSESVTEEIQFENIPDYVIENWELKNSGGNAEKEGTENPVSVTLTNEEPHKILNVNCFSLKEEENGEKPYSPPIVEVKPDGVCDGVIEWTETDSHRVRIGYNSNKKPIYSWCTHKFKYKTILEATADIMPSTLKSGYGFGVDVECTISTTLERNSGCRSWGKNRKPDATVKPPTTATVFLPWDMINRLGSQGRSISMVPEGKLKFTLPSSPVSETGAKKIYTPVELAGTKESPKSHSFEIYIGGGGVESEEFCQKLIGTITINGDMYEDDFSGAD